MEESVRDYASLARAQVSEAVRDREEGVKQLASENDLTPDLVGIDYTDIFKLAEDLGRKLNEPRSALVRSYRSSLVGWTVVSIAALLGAVASWHS